MNARSFVPVSGVLFKLVLMSLAFAATALLLRDGLAIGAHVPLDPNEGWNAYLARAAMTGQRLYPKTGLMTDNYPPLSFFLVGALGRIVGDPIVAGRLVSLVSFFAVAGSIIAILRTLGAGVLATLFACLFFATGLLAASDYVAMDDPQLLGHALQLMGLSLLLSQRRNINAAALLMAAGLFVKHNLLALPLASSLWLLQHDRREGADFVVAGLAFCLAGLVAAWLLLDVNLIAALANPRLWTAANFRAGAGQFLCWAGPGLVVMAWPIRGQPARSLFVLYAGIALALGGLFAFGDGVDANIFFDAVIALSLSLGLTLGHAPKAAIGMLALLAAAPLALYLARHHTEANAPYTEDFARESALDIGFLSVHPGPALCQDLTLCYWADKDPPVDVFNLLEAIKTGTRSDADLAHLLQSRYFGSIALTEVTALGPQLTKAMLAQYRVAHADDNGVFLERITSPNRLP